MDDGHGLVVHGDDGDECANFFDPEVLVFQGAHGVREFCQRRQRLVLLLFLLLQPRRELRQALTCCMRLFASRESPFKVQSEGSVLQSAASALEGLVEDDSTKRPSLSTRFPPISFKVNAN